MRRGRGNRTLPTTVTFLSMASRPHAPPPPSPMTKAALLKCENPPVHFYRYLYDAIGRDYFWIERRLWSDEKLAEQIQHRKVALYVLYIGGAPGGMAELDFRDETVGQICYFGLTPECIGRRIGPWFLHQIVELIWDAGVARAQVNTCTLDHRKALATYQRAGFTPYARAERAVILPPGFSRDGS